VEATVQALLVAVVYDPPEKVRPCDFQKLINCLKLKRACGIDGIPNECLRHLPRRPLVHLTHLINHCILLSHFPPVLEGKDPKFPQNLHPISLLPSTDKLFFLLAIRIKYILCANLLAQTLSSCAYYVMMRSSPVRGPLQKSIRSTGQDFFNLLLCCCSSRGCRIVLLWIFILS
jgi:hypothetical protein